jgi:uncharacterized damage-inducible protein DinB
MNEPEAWLAGPVEGVSPALMPVAHALVQARRELAAAVRDLDPAALWARPAGVASIGFHLRHLAGSTDRLRSYAEGKTLTPEQRAVLGAEGEPGTPPAAAGELLTGVDAAIDEVLEVLRATPDGDLDLPRKVGRARLPTTVRGLLYHIGEHAARHAGQVVTTAKVIAAE